MCATTYSEAVSPPASVGYGNVFEGAPDPLRGHRSLPLRD